MNVIVIGGSGLVGTNLVHQFSKHGHDVLGTYNSSETKTASKHLDKADIEEVEAFLRDHNPDLVVDTAAFHAVDDCETERDRAWSVNAQGTRNIASGAAAVGAHYVYISTDYVFPGRANDAPYTEADRVAPLNYYGRTKHTGEQAARIADKWTILRGSVIYGLASGNFLTWLLEELEAGEEIGLVTDQVSRPTYAPDIAGACVEVGERGMTGIYHASGPDSMSRYEFGLVLAEQLNLETSLISPINTEELGQEASRPADSSLESARLYDAIDTGFQTPEEAFVDVCKRR